MKIHDAVKKDLNQITFRPVLLDERVKELKEKLRESYRKNKQRSIKMVVINK